jgi:hypothetical protein
MEMKTVGRAEEKLGANSREGNCANKLYLISNRFGDNVGGESNEEDF